MQKFLLTSNPSQAGLIQNRQPTTPPAIWPIRQYDSGPPLRIMEQGVARGRVSAFQRGKYLRRTPLRKHSYLVLWQHFARQPRRRELAAAPSLISQSPYNRRFGSWTAALEAFTTYANASATEAPPHHEIVETQHSTSRDPSIRLRWKVLQRDRFTCRGCGASPALKVGVELHVDHVKPWSEGGETV